VARPWVRCGGPLLGTLATLTSCGLFSDAPAGRPSGAPVAATPSPARPGTAAALATGPLGLVPSGMEMVAELDVAQIARWPLGMRFRWLKAALPARHADWLAALIGGELPGVELAALGVGLVAPEGGEIVAVFQGHPSADTERALFMRWSAGALPAHDDYHGATLVERAGRVYAQLGQAASVFGARNDARRAVDVLHKDEDGLVQAAMARGAGSGTGQGTTPGTGLGTDRLLVKALLRAPTAKEGRVALRGALLLSPALVERLTAVGVQAEMLEPIVWVTVAVALGDGADLGVVAGARNERAAMGLLERTKIALATLKTQPAVQRLGFGPYLDAVRMGRKGVEVHLALRLEARRLVRLIERLEALWALGQGRQE
jgi:hypothetical protein